MAPSNRGYKWWGVAMLWLVCLFNYADRQAIFSVFPLLKSEIGLSDVQLGVVGGLLDGRISDAPPIRPLHAGSNPALSANSDRPLFVRVHSFCLLSHRGGVEDVCSICNHRD
jgi:hypothetical protein